MTHSTAPRARSMRRRTMASAALLVALTSTSAAEAHHQGDEQIVDSTARMLRGGEFRLGLMQLEFAPRRWFTVGTDTLPWVASLFAPVVMPNGHVKLGLLQTKPLALAVRGGLYYANVSKAIDKGDADVFIVPTLLFASTSLLDPLSLHLEGTYTWVRAGGGADLSNLTAGGGAVMNTVQLGAMAQLTLTPVTALLVRGRYQAYASPVRIDASSDSDPYTHAELSAKVRTAHGNEYGQILGGVAFSWKALNVQLAAGYGWLFLPAFGVVAPYKGLVGDGNIFFRF